MITITGHLLQSKLEAALRQMVGDDCWKGRELRVPDSRRRWDMAYAMGNQITVVEFDGGQHYWDSLKIKVDSEKDAVANSLNYRVVRIPYWVQLTNETARHYFGINTEISQDFPHGFITTKVFPASFSELGISRFTRELNALPDRTAASIIQSLRDHSQEHGVEYVVPSSLRHLLSRRSQQRIDLLDGS